MVICIDSNIVIWGIKQQANPIQANVIQRALEFFQWADDGGHQIIIPTIVLAEILSPEPPDKRIAYLKIINKSFRVCAFDDRCANVFAELMADKHPDIAEYRAEKDIRKEKMKFDMAIIATAIANRADRIYTNNLEDFEKFSLGKIGIYDLPPLTIQAEMYFPEEGEQLFALPLETIPQVRKGEEYSDIDEPPASASVLEEKETLGIVGESSNEEKDEETETEGTKD